jgi:hypothetical protein
VGAVAPGNSGGAEAGLSPPMGVSAVGLPAAAGGSPPTVVPASFTSSVTPSAALGAGPPAEVATPAGSDATRRRLSAPAASAIPPTANSSFRGRGRRCRPRGRGAVPSGAPPTRSDGPDTRGGNGVADRAGAADGRQGAGGVGDSGDRGDAESTAEGAGAAGPVPGGRRAPAGPAVGAAVGVRDSCGAGGAVDVGRVAVSVVMVRPSPTRPCPPVRLWRSADYAPGWAVWPEKARMSLVRGEGRRGLSRRHPVGALVWGGRPVRG